MFDSERQDLEYEKEDGVNIWLGKKTKDEKKNYYRHDDWYTGQAKGEQAALEAKKQARM